MKLDEVLNINTSEKLTINLNSDAEDITLYEMARWASLMRGIDIIDAKARQLKVNLDDDKTWLKPLALQKFIDEETPGVVAEIKSLLNNIDD